MIRDIWRSMVFVFTKRKILFQLKDEIMEVKTKMQEATKDKKVTKAELKGILMEVDDVLDLIIEDLLDGE